MIRLHVLQHVPFEGPGTIGDWAAARGMTLSMTPLWAGEAPPTVGDFDWLAVMGGPMNIYEEARYPWLKAEKRLIEAAVAAGKTVLGICLGAQLVADVLGGPVSRNAQLEIGWFPIRFLPAALPDGAISPIRKGLPEELTVFHWHGDTFALPPGAAHLAESDVCRNQAFVFNDRVVGLQFHLESTPETCALLVEHCGGELVPAPMVQTAAQILGERRYFGGIRQTLGVMLDNLLALPATKSPAGFIGAPTDHS